MAGQNLPWNGKWYLLWNSFLSKNGGLIRNIGSRYVRKPINGSEDAEFQPNFQKNQSKMDCWFSQQGYINFAQNSKAPSFVNSAAENSKPKNENFLNRIWKTCRFQRVFKQLSSSSSWRFMAKNIPAIILGGAGLEVSQHIYLTNASPQCFEQTPLPRTRVWSLVTHERKNERLVRLFFRIPLYIKSPNYNVG